MSLDGVVAHPEKWMSMTDEILADSVKRYSTLGASIFGGNSYSSLTTYWMKAEKSSKSANERLLAKKINAIEKYVFSRSRIDLKWPNTNHLKVKNSNELVAAIRKLKRTKGKDISVDAGLTSWRLFLKNNLFDELLIFVEPIIANKGKKLFSKSHPRANLKLTATKKFKNGVISLRYQKA
jgi:dihydrofolate reductase